MCHSYEKPIRAFPAETADFWRKRGHGQKQKTSGTLEIPSAGGLSLLFFCKEGGQLLFASCKRPPFFQDPLDLFRGAAASNGCFIDGFSFKDGKANHFLAKASHLLKNLLTHSLVHHSFSSVETVSIHYRIFNRIRGDKPKFSTSANTRQATMMFACRVYK